jgi:hypothetical protein
MMNLLSYQGWETYTKCNIGPILLTPQISPSIVSTSSMVLMMMAVAAKFSLNKRVLALGGILLHLYHLNKESFFGFSCQSPSVRILKQIISLVPETGPREEREPQEAEDFMSNVWVMEKWKSERG